MRAAWRGRAQTLRAMALLLCARALVAAIPFGRWRGRLGSRLGEAAPSDPRAVRRLAGQVERAAWRLPLATKCLPRAMALSWLLRRAGQPHSVTLAVRPPDHRGSADDLHAWVSAGDTIVLGDVPGPWLTVLRQGE